jgi:8-oxo-dGTP pyrophosphatase MutT (NUDIX family)
MTSDDRWRVQSTRTVLRDRWIDVRADSCVTPAGISIDPYYVLSYADFVHIVAVTPDDCLVMVRQYRHAAGEVFLELPGGIADATDGRPEVTASRELLEETGYEAAGMRLAASLFVNPATHNNRIHTCVATDAVRAGAQALEAGEEGLAVELIPVARVIAGLSDGLIRGSMVVTSIMLGLASVGRLTYSAA